MWCNSHQLAFQLLSINGSMVSIANVAMLSHTSMDTTCCVTRQQQTSMFAKQGTCHCRTTMRKEKKKGEGGSTHIITDSLLERLLSLHLDAAQGARRQCRHSETLLCCLFRYESAHTARGNGSPVSFSGSRVSPDVATRTTYVHIGSFFKCH